jgi:hypothetical protein
VKWISFSYVELRRPGREGEEVNE